MHITLECLSVWRAWIARPVSLITEKPDDSTDRHGNKLSMAHGWHVADACNRDTRNGFRRFHGASAVGRSVSRSVGQSVSRSVGQSVSQSVSSGNRRSLASHRSASRPGGAAMDTVQAKVCRNHTASVESRMKTAFIAGRQNWHRYRRGGPPHRIQCRLIANRPNVPSAPDRSEILLRGTSWRSFFLRVENKEGRTRSLIAPSPATLKPLPASGTSSAPQHRISGARRWTPGRS